MKLNLTELPNASALLLAAIAADQAAKSLGCELIFHSVTPTSLEATIDEAGERVQEVVAAHVGRAVGKGFEVAAAGAGGLLIVTKTATRPATPPMPQQGHQQGQGKRRD